MAALPSQVWIRTQGKDAPDWVVSYMATGRIEPDGSFDIDTPDGPTKVGVGDAIFVFSGNAYVCPPKLMQEKLSAIAPVDVASVLPKLAVKPASGTKAPDRPLKFKPMIGSPPAPQFAGVNDLQVDDTYQRSIEGGASRKLIEKIAIGWDWRLCLPLLVSRRDGTLYVIDGQHRLEAARMRGDIQHMPIVVFDFDSPAAEAELFVQANRSRRPMQKLDEFHAAVAAGDEKATAITLVVEEAGLRIGRSSAWQMLKPGEVVFIAGIDRNVRLHTREVAVFALKLMAEAFNGQPMLGGGSIFDCLCIMIHEGDADGNPVDGALLGMVLSGVGLDGWRETTVGADHSDDRREMMLKAMRDAYAEARVQ